VALVSSILKIGTEIGYETGLLSIILNVVTRIGNEKGAEIMLLEKNSWFFISSTYASS
jgi:hypothetical protein